MKNYKRDLDNITRKILTIKNFDLESFTNNYRKLVDNIWFFHNVIGREAKNEEELSLVQYKLSDNKKPKIGQIGYFFIENSFPKEIFNGHWCLVFKDFGNMAIIIPLTSIKKDSTPLNKDMEIIVKVKDFEEEGCSKLRINQMFCADIMRIDKNRKIYDLQTDFNLVKNKIYSILQN